MRVEASKGTLASLEMTPLQIKRFRLNYASAEDALWVKKVLDKEGKKFGNEVELRSDNSLMLRWWSS